MQWKKSLELIKKARKYKAREKELKCYLKCNIPGKYYSPNKVWLPISNNNAFVRHTMTFLRYSRAKMRIIDSGVDDNLYYRQNI